MFLSVRARILVWLLIVLFPVVAASVAATHIVDRDLSSRIVADLENVRRLESARIEQMLGSYAREAASLADDPLVVDFTQQLHDFRRGYLGEDAVVGGYNGFDTVNPVAERPLQQLLDVVEATSRSSAGRAIEFRLVDTDGTLFGRSPGFSWAPYDDSLLQQVVDTREVAFGNAFRNADGDERLGLVTPVRIAGGEVVGAIEMEMDLGPITDFVVEHETFGDTSEAHIAQPTPDGDAEFITLLRFQRDAAFDEVVPKSAGLPINRALRTPDGLTIRSPDYRGVDSVQSIETIAGTGWGLVVKVDRAEALAPLDRVRRVIALAGAAAAAAVLIGWGVVLRPLVARLRRASVEAQNVGAGLHAPIGDLRRDEIGEMARTIDQLAEDLAADRRIRADFERELVRRATHDDLTGLVNRQHATSMVAELLDHDEAASSLLFIDLDGFKSINDTYGHLIGDEVLISVARRLLSVAGDGAIVSRWGGDEFVVVLPGGDSVAASEFADRARAAFDEPIATTVGPQQVRWSLGTATTEAGRTLDELLVDADRRMFEEKQARKGRNAVSSATLREIESALVDGRIEAFLQPIVDADDPDAPRLWGAEALVRLRQSDGTVRTPAAFLDAAQDNHLGAAIDDRVASLAIDHVGRWVRRGAVDPDFKLSLNVCEASSRDPELVHRLGLLLEKAGLAPSSVIIEISEETRHIDPVSLERLRTLGVAIAVDDVGVGRSGVARLIDTAATVGKIDGRWVNETMTGHDPAASPVVEQLHGLCRMLGMTVVVEGIERPEQRDRLLSIGITRMQGYLFARPMSPADFEAAWANSTVAEPELAVQPV